MLRAICIVFLVLIDSILAAAAGGEKTQLPGEIKSALEKADSLELFSLDPEAEVKSPKDSFHGWKILGKATIKDKELRTKLLAAFQKGISEHKPEQGAEYISPRHGIRVTSEKGVTDLVICFTSKQITVYTDKTEKSGKIIAATSPSPAAVFDEVLRKENVPLAPKKKG